MPNTRTYLITETRQTKTSVAPLDPWDGPGEALKKVNEGAVWTISEVRIQAVEP